MGQVFGSSRVAGQKTRFHLNLTVYLLLHLLHHIAAAAAAGDAGGDSVSLIDFHLQHSRDDGDFFLTLVHRAKDIQTFKYLQWISSSVALRNTGRDPNRQSRTCAYTSHGPK